MGSALSVVQWKSVFWIPKHVNLKSLSTMTTIKGSVYEIKEAGVVLIQAPLCLASQNKGTCFIWAGRKSQFVADYSRTDPELVASIIKELVLMVQWILNEIGDIHRTRGQLAFWRPTISCADLVWRLTANTRKTEANLLHQHMWLPAQRIYHHNNRLSWGPSMLTVP